MATSNTAMRLSQYTVGEEGSVMCNSVRRDCSQVNSAVTTAKLRYSASVLERETTAYFLELQETKSEPRYTL